MNLLYSLDTLLEQVFTTSTTLSVRNNLMNEVCRSQSSDLTSPPGVYAISTLFVLLSVSHINQDSVPFERPVADYVSLSIALCIPRPGLHAPRPSGKSPGS